MGFEEPDQDGLALFVVKNGKKQYSENGNVNEKNSICDKCTKKLSDFRNGTNKNII